jgi:integrase
MKSPHRFGGPGLFDDLLDDVSGEARVDTTSERAQDGTDGVGRLYRRRTSARTPLHERSRVPAVEPKRRKGYQQGSLKRVRRKRGPSVWEYRYFDTIDGERKRRKAIIGTVVQYPTKSEARRASEYLRLQVNAEWTKPNVTVGCLIDHYMDQCIRPALDVPLGGMTKSPGRRLDYSAARDQRSHINCHIRDPWEHHLVRDFERPEIRASVEDWIASLLDPPDSYAGPTVAAIFNTMRDLFKFAVRRNYISVNPFGEGRIELPPGCSKRAKAPLDLSPQQFKRLVSNLDLREKLAVTLAAWVAPRVSEIFGLKWQDIGFDEGRIVFRQGLRDGRVSGLKNDASRTDSAAAPEILELLRNWYCRTPYRNQTNWVFASPLHRGRLPMWPKSLMYHIKKVASALELPDIGWHTFRHSAASWAKKARLNLEEIRILLRHQTVDMAAEVYGRVELEQKKQIQRRLITFVNKQASTVGGQGQKNGPNLTLEKRIGARKTPRMLELKLG